LVQVNIRIDEKLKEKADALFDDLGLNMTTAFVMFLKACNYTEPLPTQITSNRRIMIIHKKFLKSYLHTKT